MVPLVIERLPCGKFIDQYDPAVALFPSECRRQKSVAGMNRHCSLGNSQNLADLPVAFPLRNAADHVTFTGREARAALIDFDPCRSVYRTIGIDGRQLDEKAILSRPALLPSSRSLEIR